MINLSWYPEKEDSIVDLELVPFHMRGDYEVRNDNVKNKRLLCNRCDGTGNELFSMYKKCEDCLGKGYHD